MATKYYCDACQVERTQGVLHKLTVEGRLSSDPYEIEIDICDPCIYRLKRNLKVNYLPDQPAPEMKISEPDLIREVRRRGYDVEKAIEVQSG